MSRRLVENIMQIVLQEVLKVLTSNNTLDTPGRKNAPNLYSKFLKLKMMQTLFEVMQQLAKQTYLCISSWWRN